MYYIICKWAWTIHYTFIFYIWSFYDVAIKTFRFVNTHLTASNKNESANQNAVIIIALEIGFTGHTLNFCLNLSVPGMIVAPTVTGKRGNVLINN